MEIHWSPFAPTPASDVLHQHPGYGQVLRLLGSDIRWASLRDGGQTLAHAQMIFRSLPGRISVAYLPYGPVWQRALDPDHRARALSLLTRQARLCISAAATPDCDADFARDGQIPIVTPQTRAHLDLSGTPQQLRAAQTVKWRNRLTHAEAAGLAIRETTLPPDPAHWLLRVEAAQRRERRYRALPVEFAALYARLYPQNCHLFTAYQGRQRIAAMLMLRHGCHATYHIGWNDTLGRDLSAHNLLLWQAALALQSRGCTSLDLGTIDTEQGSGLARFKLGSGARPVQSGHTWLHTAPTTALFRPFAARRSQAAA